MFRQEYHLDSLSPLAIVVALCRRDVDPVALARARAAVVADTARAGLVDRAGRLRVQGLVLDRLLASSDGPPLAATAATSLAERLAGLRHAAEALDLERDRLIAALGHAGVRTVLLKGAALRATVYAARPVRRQVGDLDVLVARQDVDVAVSAAVDAGYAAPSAAVRDAYQRHHFHVQLRHPFGYVVEVHWALVEPHAPMGLDPEAVRREAVLVSRADAPAFWMPRAEHMVLHLVQQVAQERCACFARLVDVDRILAATPDIDWDLLRRTAHVAGLDTALALTLRLAATFLGTPVPPALQGSAVTRFHLDRLALVRRLLMPERSTRFTDDALLDLWLADGWSRRIRGLARLANADHAVDPLHRALGDLAARGAAARWLALGKIAARQASLYWPRDGRHEREPPVELDHLGRSSL